MSVELSELRLLSEENFSIRYFLERFSTTINEDGIALGKNISMTEERLNFITELSMVYDSPDTFNPAPFLSCPLDYVLDYLRITHQYYLNRKLPLIQSTLHHWSASEKSVIAKLATHFLDKYHDGMKQHIQKEEGTLFPYIDTLIKMSNGVEVAEYCILDKKLSLIQFLMKHDHEIEEELSSFVKVMIDYESSFSDNLAFRNLVNQIRSLEVDLTIHAKMEEEVLIPKAAELEQEVLVDHS